MSASVREPIVRTRLQNADFWCIDDDDEFLPLSEAITGATEFLADIAEAIVCGSIASGGYTSDEIEFVFSDGTVTTLAEVQMDEKLNSIRDTLLGMSDESLQVELWDFYKSVHGVRPRHVDMESRDAIIASLLDVHRYFAQMNSTESGRVQMRAEGWSI